MKITKKIIAIVLALVLLLSLFGCKQQDDKIDGLVIGTMTTIEKATRDEYNYDVLSGMMTQMALVGTDENGNAVPQLATFKTTDSKTWEYTIKDGFTWHDGTKLTGEDVLFTLNYLDAEEGKTYFKGDTPTYTSAKLSQDKMTITFELANANVKDAGNFSTVRIIPKHIYEGKKMAEVSDSDSRIGCGAYIFEKFDKNAGTVSFVANKDYVDGLPNVNRVIFKMFSNEDTMYLALAHGEVDLLYTYSRGISPIAVKTLENNENVTLQALTSTNLPAVLTFNNSIPPFNDVNLRLAVKYAINYDKFVELFSSPYGETAREGFVPKGTIGYAESKELKRDLSLAEEYLKKAGYDKSDIVDGYHTKDGKRLSFVLTVNGGKEIHARYAELVKENLKDVGIEVVIETLDGNTYNAKTANKYSNGNPTHQSAIMGYTSAGMAMMSGLGTIYIDGNHTVQGGAQVFDPKFDEIISNLKSSNTIEQYIGHAKECQEYYANNAPAIALFWDSSVQAYNKKLSGLVVDSNFGLLNYRTWFSIKADK